LVSPSSFRKEHILQQVRYVLKKYFAPREHQFIKNISVDVGKHSALIIITTIENRKHKREVKYSHDKDFILKFSKLKEDLKNIIAGAKKHLKDNEKMIESSSDSSKSSNQTRKSTSSKSKNKTITKSSTRTLSSVAKLPSRFKNGSSSTNTLKNLEEQESTKAISIYKTKENKEEEKGIQGNIPAGITTTGGITARTNQMLQSPIQAQPMQGQQQCEMHTDFISCRNAGCYFDRTFNKCTPMQTRSPTTGYQPPTTGYPPRQPQSIPPPPQFVPPPSPLGTIGTNAPKPTGMQGF